MASIPVQVRPLAGYAEFDACVALQQEIWGPGFNEAVPASLLAVVPRVGGVSGGAFGPEGELLGFVFGFTGPEAGSGALVHWSDILGVSPAARGRGIARQLKAWQGDAARRAGAERMQWTFDPLQARNAWFNVDTLGARIVAYLPEFYPASTSPLHAGGTDRLLAEWDLRPGGTPAPATRGDSIRRIAIPAELEALPLPDRRERRLAVRAAFQAAFAEGLQVIGIERSEGTVAYLLADTVVAG